MRSSQKIPKPILPPCGGTDDLVPICAVVFGDRMEINMKRIIIYGDSILRGITYSAETQRHKLCQGYKLNTLSDIGYEVINHARMGATIHKGFAVLDGTLTEDIAKGSTVLLEFGGNDSDYTWGEISDDPHAIHLPHTSEDDFLHLYGKAIETAKVRGASVVLSSLVPIDAYRYMHTISRGRSYENILAWLGDVSMLYRYHEHYNMLVRSLARKYDCPLLDVREQFLLAHNYKDLISEDGIHPTEEGHALVESSIRQYLEHTQDSRCA